MVLGLKQLSIYKKEKEGQVILFYLRTIFGRVKVIVQNMILLEFKKNRQNSGRFVSVYGMTPVVSNKQFLRRKGAAVSLNKFFFLKNAYNHS